MPHSDPPLDGKETILGLAGEREVISPARRDNGGVVNRKSEQMILVDSGVGKREALLKCAHLPVSSVIQNANRLDM